MWAIITIYGKFGCPFSSFHVPHLSLFLIRTKGAYVKVPQPSAISVVNAIVPNALSDLRDETVW